VGPEVIGFPQLRSIQVKNSQGAGNPYFCRSLFAPAFQLQIEDPAAEQESPFSIVFELPQDQFALNQSEVDFYGVFCDLSRLVQGSVVGSAEIGFDPYEMVVTSSDENQAILGLVVPGTEKSVGTLTFDLDSSGADLQISLMWAEPYEEPYLMYQAQRTRFDFSDLFLGLPAEDRSVLALARFLSSPTEGYPDSALLCHEATQIEVE
jgi:hypothetical protein